MAAGFVDLYRRLLGWWAGEPPGTANDWPKVHDYVNAIYTVHDYVDSP